MNSALEEIEREIQRLDPAQRAELADFLAASLEASQPDEIQRLWIDEADRRLAEVRSGAVTGIPGEKVLADARRLSGR